MVLATKEDFSTYVQFTTNIPDRLITYHRDKAETLDFKPLVPAAFWTKIIQSSPGIGAELQDFIDDYIKPIIIHFAMLRFLVEHGRNITQFGLVVPIENTSQPAANTDRADVRNQYNKDLQSYLKLFYSRLKEVSYTFDGTVYNFDCNRKQTRILIKAI